MVQLSPSQTPESLTPPEKEDLHGSPKPDSPQRLTAFQLALNPCSTTYHGYEKYIENGLICLKHKIRNIEKKKLKLESYSDRLKNGDKLNPDQLEAVGKYEEVVHNLKFAKELQKTISALTQDLLKAQRKAVRQEKVMRFESERTRLSMMLQVQYVLHSLQREDVRRNFCNARQQSCCLSTQEMESLLDLATLLGCKRDHSMSLEEQMEQAALVYWELMEGNEKPVAGSTYKLMKEKLLQLVDCGFFDHVPLPQKDDLEKTDTPSRPHDTTSLTKMSPKEVASKEFLNSLKKSGLAHCNPNGNLSPCNWKEDFTVLKEREPPDSWEMEFTNLSAVPQPVIQKPWKGAAGLIPKNPDTAKRPVVDPKAKRQNKCKGEHDAKPMAVSVEVFSSPSSLPKDPIQRKQQLETLMDQISGSFSFMQDSLLDGDSPLVQTKRLRPSPGTSTPIAQRILPKNPVEILAPLQITTPIRILGKGCRSGEDGDSGSELDASHESKLCNGDESFTTPPLYSRRPAMSLPLESPSPAKTRNVGKQMLCNGVSSFPPQTFSTPPKRHSNVESAFHNIHSVFHVPSLPNNDISGLKTNESGFSESMSLSHASNKPTNYSSSSTQTPPELNPAEEDLQFDVPYQLEYPVSTGHMFPIPHPPPRLGQSGYSRNILKVGYDACRVSARSPGRSFASQNQMSSLKDSASTVYMARGNGFQQSFKRNTASHRSNAGWSDTSQVSSPDREGPYPGDSGISDTLSITPLDVPITPQGPHTLMPVHVYPLTQLRVAFSAARTANFTPGTLDQPIAFDLLHSNLGDMFDTATGRFTCPASGTYVFIFHILKLAISVPLYVNLMRNEEVMVSAYANDGAPDHETASNHAVLQLFQGDQVWLRLHRGAIYGSSWKYSTFSGFLLYQD